MSSLYTKLSRHDQKQKRDRERTSKEQRRHRANPTRAVHLFSPWSFSILTRQFCNTDLLLFWSGGPLRNSYSLQFSSRSVPMQTPKSSCRPVSHDVPQKPSPTTPRTSRKLRTPGSDPNSASSPNAASKPSKDRSPRVVNLHSRQSLATEKKKSCRVSELESHVINLQEDLKKAKDQLSLCESFKTSAQQEAEEAKKQFTDMSTKLEQTQKQLKELTDSEEARFQEIQMISQDHDMARQSELETVKQQHSLNLVSLTSALNEIQSLKSQLEKISESEASRARQTESTQIEIQSLKLELKETSELVEKLMTQVKDTRASEAQAIEELSRAQILLVVIKTTKETLQLEHGDVMESYRCLLVELEQSNKRVKSLEEIVTNLQADLANSCNISAISSDGRKASCENGEYYRSEELKTELANLKNEAKQLKEVLEDAEKQNHKRTLESNLVVKNAYELMELAKSESYNREAELEAKLEESRVEAEGLRTKLIQKDDMLKSIACKNEMNQNVKEDSAIKREAELELDLKKSESVLQDLKTSLSDKESRLQSIAEENNMLKSEITKWEIERGKMNDEALAHAEASKAAEQEALKKLAHLTEETDKSHKKVASITEQLNAVQAASSNMEMELRKLKVQSDQWRKAAEASAAMLSNGKYTERVSSLDYNTIGGKLGSPFSKHIKDESPKKKNGSVLKKIGVLLKKEQK